MHIGVGKRLVWGRDVKHSTDSRGSELATGEIFAVKVDGGSPIHINKIR